MEFSVLDYLISKYDQELELEFICKLNTPTHSHTPSAQIDPQSNNRQYEINLRLIKNSICKLINFALIV